jgi:hypothetical protein
MKQVVEEVAAQGEAAAETVASEMSEATPEAPEQPASQSATQQQPTAQTQSQAQAQPATQPVVEPSPSSQPVSAAVEPSPVLETVSPGVVNAGGQEVDLKKFTDAIDRFAGQYEDPNLAGNIVIDRILKSDNPGVLLKNMLGSDNPIQRDFAKSFLIHVAPKVMGTEGVSWAPGATMPLNPPLSKLGPVLKALGTQFK